MFCLPLRCVEYPPSSKALLKVHSTSTFELHPTQTWSKVKLIAPLDYKEAISLVERFSAKITWLEDQKVPFTFFDNGGLLEYIFFENAQSFQHKLELVKKYKLRGFSVWVIGEEDPEIWEVLDKVKMK